jgi:2-oxoglutarate dehydrogenase E1 component
LRAIYSSTIGYGLDHIHIPEERHWLRHAAESGRFRPPQDPIDPTGLLERLTQVEVFERFLHRMFPGKTRFSIEGLDTMVPILDQVIGKAAEAGIYNILIGMAHRGRLNVLTHVLNKPYAQVLAAFKDPMRGSNVAMLGDLGWAGDVKYHAGARRPLSGASAASSSRRAVRRGTRAWRRSTRSRNSRRCPSTAASRPNCATAIIRSTGAR